MTHHIGRNHFGNILEIGDTVQADENSPKFTVIGFSDMDIWFKKSRGRTWAHYVKTGRDGSVHIPSITRSMVRFSDMNRVYGFNVDNKGNFVEPAMNLELLNQAQALLNQAQALLNQAQAL